tara:strand:- start:301 stop:834 length:534 start_codon:yes stop_codon:yes gene_type:complete
MNDSNSRLKSEINRDGKGFQIIENGITKLKGQYTKWYSISDLQFHYNNKTFNIKKKRFWGINLLIEENGRSLGEVVFSFRNGRVVHLKDENSKLSKYTLKSKKTGKWYVNQRNYTLYKDNTFPILKIIHQVNDWKSNYKFEFTEKEKPNYILLAIAFFLMNLDKAARASAGGGISTG